MTRTELIAALNDLWRSYNAVNSRTLSTPLLVEVDADKVPAMEAKLAEWFTPKET